LQFQRAAAGFLFICPYSKRQRLFGSDNFDQNYIKLT